MARLATAARFAGIDGGSTAEVIDRLLDRIDGLKQEIDEPLTLAAAGISIDQLDAELKQLVQLAEKDVNMYSSPCECKGEALKDLFVRMWTGR